MAEISLTAELSAMQDIAMTLHRLDQPTRARVLHWIVDRFQTDADLVVNSAPSIAPAAGTELRLVRPTAEGVDETLSMATLNDLFEPTITVAPKIPVQTAPQSITGMLQDLVAEFQGLAREWNEPESHPADKPDAKPVVPLAS
jgi:hypothetical protein